MTQTSNPILSAYYIDSSGHLIYGGFPVEFDGFKYEDFQPGAKWPFHGRAPRLKYEVWGVLGREPEHFPSLNYTEHKDPYLCHGVYGAIGPDGAIRDVVINNRLGLKHVLNGDTFRAFDYWNV